MYIRKNINRVVFSIAGGIFLVLIAISLIKQGIMCNDELVLRLLRIKGLKDFFITNFEISTGNGRLLGAIVSTKILSYISPNMLISRFWDYVLIMVTVISFGFLVYKITKDKVFSAFSGWLIIAYIPITFEHTVPNAFISVMCVPMTLLFISLGLEIEAIQKSKKRILVISMILLFLALMMYEFVIMYAPLFWFAILYASHNKKEKFFPYIKRMWKIYLIPLFVCITYLILYIISGKLFPSGYEGNSLGFVSIKESLVIIFQLLKSAIPGYYFFNTKYKYLMNIYDGNITMDNFLNIRMLTLIACFIIIYVLLAKRSKTFDCGCIATIKKRGILIGVGILAMVLPTIPISISAGYQGVVNETQYIALPVSFCVFFAVVFVISLVAWEVMTKLKTKGKIVVGILLCVVFSQIQIMNQAFSDVQYNYFKLLESEEDIFKTDLLHDLNIKKLYAKDLFEQHMCLAIHDSYWTEYISVVGLDMDIVNEEGEKDDWRLYVDQEGLYVLTNESNIYVISDKTLDGNYSIKIDEDQELSIYVQDGIEDYNKKIYTSGIVDN